MNRKANYIIIKFEVNEEGSRIVIRDMGPWDKHLSVTNDAENVVKELIAQGKLPAGRRLFYYDSDGRLDELIIKDGQFVGFAPGPGNE